MKKVARFKSLVIFVNGHWEGRKKSWQSPGGIGISICSTVAVLTELFFSSERATYNSTGQRPVNSGSIKLAPRSNVEKREKVTWGKIDNL